MQALGCASLSYLEQPQRKSQDALANISIEKLPDGKLTGSQTSGCFWWTSHSMVEVTLQKASESREAWPSQGIPHWATSLAFINPPSPLFMQTQVAAAFDHAHRASLCPWAIASLSSSGVSRHTSHLPALGTGWSVPPPATCSSNPGVQRMSSRSRAESGWSLKGLN